MFIFGDFNFRLDSHLLIQEITDKSVPKQTKGKKDQVSKIVYTEEENEKVVLTVESKLFNYHDKHSEFFNNKNNWLQQFDTELNAFKDQITEFDISFPPSYPFSEDTNDGLSYMKTRCPSWCDRVLYNHKAKDIMFHDDDHPYEYDVIGHNTCMGDHKPVYLLLYIKNGTAKSNEDDITESALTQPLLTTDIIVPSTQVKISQVDTTKYIHVQHNGASVRVFRETSV